MINSYIETHIKFYSIACKTHYFTHSSYNGYHTTEAISLLSKFETEFKYMISHSGYSCVDHKHGDKTA